MKTLFLFVLAAIAAAVIYFGGCGKVSCDCGCSDCSPSSCVGHCDGERCYIGEKCCNDCSCKK